jgi:hypothetical protein
MRAAELVARLGGRMSTKRAGVARCPVHDDRTPSLAVADGHDGNLLVHCHAGCTQIAVIAELRQRDLWPSRGPVPEPTAAEKGGRSQHDRREAERVRRERFVERSWRNTWAEARPAVESSEIRMWIRNRGIDPAALELDRLDALRWHARCPLGRERAPAMIALMTDAITGDATGIHRSFLTPDGSMKAVDVPNTRMFLGRSGIIRLSPDEGVELGLGICEGIETGLAIMNIGWRPIWACGSLDRLRRFPVLGGIEALTIFADPKPHEIEGARECALRWQEAGREAWIKRNSRGDFNDVLRVAQQ